MPYLNLEGKFSNDLNRKVFCCVLGGIMIYPGDKSKGEAFGFLQVKSWWVKQELKTSKTNLFMQNPENREKILKRLEKPFSVSNLKPEEHELYKKGMAMGGILRTFLKRKEKQSLRNLLWEIQEDIGKPLGWGSSTFSNNIYPNFKPVAHFWATHLDFCLSKDLKRFPCNSEDLLEFLARSEAYRSLGEKIKPTNHSHSFLRKSDTWKVPETFALPEAKTLF